MSPGFLLYVQNLQKTRQIIPNSAADLNACASCCCLDNSRPFVHDTHSRPQRPRSFWSAPRIATSGQVQHRKSAIHGLPVTLRMFRVKFDKFVWFWSQSIVFTKPFKNGMSLDPTDGDRRVVLGQRSRFLVLTKRSAASGD